MKREVLGWLLMAVGVLPILTFLLFTRAEYVFWFSNHTFVVLGLAVLFRSRFWVLAELCIGLIPESMWSVDFLARLFTGEHVFGFTSYMFKNGAFDWLHLYSLQHILFVPAALYALYVLGGPEKGAWAGSLYHMIILWPLSFAFGTEFNLNCVFHDCGVFGFLPHYQFTWPLLIITNVLVAYGLVTWFWKK